MMTTLKDVLLATCLALVLFWIVAIPFFGNLPDLEGALHFSGWTAGAALLWLLIVCWPTFLLLRTRGWTRHRWLRWFVALALALLPVLALHAAAPRPGGGKSHGGPEALFLFAVPWILAFFLAGSFLLGRLAKREL
jgi:hypothetical protein